MIDFDDSSTFLNVIRQWVLNQKDYFLSHFNKEDYVEWWELEHQLCDIRLWEQAIKFLL